MNCPITNEKIAIITIRGIERISNYCEVYFLLNDKSLMKISLSKNALANIKEKHFNDFFKNNPDKEIVRLYLNNPKMQISEIALVV